MTEDPNTIPAVQPRTWFSRALRRALWVTVLPRFGDEHREAYEAQFGEASRNAEIAVEGLGRLVNRHALSVTPVLGALTSWARHYHGAQRGAADKDRYLVYTDLDAAIPFRPEADTLYAYMATQVTNLATDLADVLPRPELKRAVGAFTDMNAVASAAFRRFPTVMPRFTGHDRLSLRVVQALDRPLNCCPSLHIAYTIMIDDVARAAFEPHVDKAPALAAVRAATAGMVESVLYTKQHAILDVAFGMLCARIVHERRFDRPFPDPIALLDAAAGAQPIPHAAIAALYEEACWRYARADDLAGALGDFLDDHRYPLVPADAVLESCFVDAATGELVRER
jgi:hypothetical protein